MNKLNSITSQDETALTTHESSILRYLRESSQFHDGEIIVDEHKFMVHRDVVSAASPFLATAFSGPYREAKEARVTVTEATIDAMRVVIDYCYGLPFLRSDGGGGDKTPELTERVYWLARHLLINQLAKDAGLHLVSITQDSKLDQVYDALSPDIDPRVENELARRMLRNAAFQSLNTAVLDAHFLLRLLESPDLIAAEADILRAILKWEEARDDVSSSELERLLSLVSFQRIQTKDLHLLLRFRNVPKAIWLRALDSTDRPRNCAMLTKQLDSFVPLRIEELDRKLRRRNISRQTFSLPLSFDDAYVKCSSSSTTSKIVKSFQLSHNSHDDSDLSDMFALNLALSIHFYLVCDQLCLALTIDRRESPGRCRTLAEELEGSYVHCALRLHLLNGDSELFTSPGAEHAPGLVRKLPVRDSQVVHDETLVMLRMDKTFFVNPDGGRWWKDMGAHFLFTIGY